METKLKHTLGPWQVKVSSNNWNVVTCEKPRSFNIVTVNPDRIEVEANARLIAASPELLEQVKSYMDFCIDLLDMARIGSEVRSELDRRIMEARAAIAKAEGK